MVQRRSKGGVDIEVLVLKNVTNGVQGDYICERKTTGQATEARFKVLYKGKYCFLGHINKKITLQVKRRSLVSETGLGHSVIIISA